MSSIKTRRITLYLRRRQGFTLIELIITIGLLGVLSSVLLFVINPLGQLAKTRDSNRKVHLRSISKAFEEYTIINGGYPTLPGTHCIGIADSQSCWGDRNMPGSDSLIQMLSPYMKAFPQDPLSDRGWGDRYLYLDGATSITGCNATTITGHYILWRPDKQPTAMSDCQSFGYLSCCGTGGPCGNQGGYFCAYKLD